MLAQGPLGRLAAVDLACCGWAGEAEQVFAPLVLALVRQAHGVPAVDALVRRGGACEGEVLVRRTAPLRGAVAQKGEERKSFLLRSEMDM